MSDEDPEIQARINRLLDQVFATIETNKAKLRNELLPLLGLMSVEFNRMEGDFKYLLILLLNEPSLPQARKVALESKSFDKLLKRLRSSFPRNFRSRHRQGIQRNCQRGKRPTQRTQSDDSQRLASDL